MNSTTRPKLKPPIPHSKYKPSAAKRVQSAFSQLCQVLNKEWQSIRSSNLGVQSGTGVIEDVLYSQLHQLASTVHMLAVSDAEASQVLVGMACRLSTQQFQQLQVLLDVLGLEELSDYLRLMCSSLQQHSRAVAAASTRPSTGSTAATAAGDPPGSSSILKTPGSRYPAGSDSSAGPGLTSRQRRMRAAAGVFELSQSSFTDGPTSFQQSLQQQLSHSGGLGLYGGSSSPEPSQIGLKFAHLLPPGHILVKTAEALQQQQQFQAALLASATTPRHVQQRVVVPPLQLPPPQHHLLSRDDVFNIAHLEGAEDDPAGHPVGQWGQGRGSPPSTAGSLSSRIYFPQPAKGPWWDSSLQAPQHHHAGAFFLSTGGDQLYRTMQQQQQQGQGQRWQLFQAPVMSTEQLWKAGRAATTAAVLQAAHLSVHESTGDALSLLLTPGLLVSQQQQQRLGQRSHTSTPEAAGSTSGGSKSRLASRRGSTANSRPNSARNRPNSALPPLQLQKLEAVAGAVGERRGSSSDRSRPGSAAATSRLGAGRHTGSSMQHHSARIAEEALGGV